MNAVIIKQLWEDNGRLFIGSKALQALAPWDALTQNESCTPACPTFGPTTVPTQHASLSASHHELAQWQDNGKTARTLHHATPPTLQTAQQYTSCFLRASSTCPNPRCTSMGCSYLVHGIASSEPGYPSLGSQKHDKQQQTSRLQWETQEQQGKQGTVTTSALLPTKRDPL